eukprot:CAMPEP_0115839042 /NCGR_PEP_ID=MMETSP0287-20121206/6049_1 /TAXON_ID=412157 /ORGANISM="Chrysochromulina rotalis, Strain UIO044" /LENGTH=107 /DNA_ID=CAMNT_0003292605 /DNA_START=980 /DNA_END=1304 /DNA_ORIENTATION=+
MRVGMAAREPTVAHSEDATVGLLEESCGIMRCQQCPWVLVAQLLHAWQPPFPGLLQEPLAADEASSPLRKAAANGRSNSCKSADAVLGSDANFILGTTTTVFAATFF